jgi:hypothetical protein
MIERDELLRAELREDVRDEDDWLRPEENENVEKFENVEEREFTDCPEEKDLFDENVCPDETDDAPGCPLDCDAPLETPDCADEFCEAPEETDDAPDDGNEPVLELLDDDGSEIPEQATKQLKNVCEQPSRSRHTLSLSQQ